VSHSAATASRAQITHSRAASQEWDGNPLSAQIGGYLLVGADQRLLRIVTG